jgi:phage recombination protein Bet
MWDSKAKAMRDVVMPGVNLYLTQAARSGQFAGMSEPEFGPDETVTLGGQTVTFPVWCRVTVRRLLSNGAVAEFTAREFWLENYAIKGGAEKSLAPNAMWMKRPRGQIAKCASAQALRIAFPEIASQPTADEMEGKQIHPDDAPAHADGLSVWVAKVQATTTDKAAAEVWAAGGAAIAATKDKSAYMALRDAVIAHRNMLREATDAARTIDAEEASQEATAATQSETEAHGG